jgi:hypothetical protein
MSNVQSLLKDFSSQRDKSFGDCVKYLVSKGCDKTTAEFETKEYFRHPVEHIPIGLDKDIEIDIKAL